MIFFKLDRILIEIRSLFSTITNIFSRTQFQEVMPWYISFKWRRNMIVEKKNTWHVCLVPTLINDRDKLIGEVRGSTCTVKVYFFLFKNTNIKFRRTILNNKVFMIKVTFKKKMIQLKKKMTKIDFFIFNFVFVFKNLKSF